MTDKIVELIRRFEPMSSRSWEWDFLSQGPGRPRRWYEIEEEHRVLIIADPGAGKTFEAKTRARKIRERGKKAFFIRIESIDASFEGAFEIGTAEEFDSFGPLPETVTNRITWASLVKSVKCWIFCLDAAPLGRVSRCMAAGNPPGAPECCFPAVCGPRSLI